MVATYAEAETCASCLHYVEKNGGAKPVGYCRRFPTWSAIGTLIPRSKETPIISEAADKHVCGEWVKTK